MNLSPAVRQEFAMQDLIKSINASMVKVGSMLKKQRESFEGMRDLLLYNLASEPIEQTPAIKRLVELLSLESDRDDAQNLELKNLLVSEYEIVSTELQELWEKADRCDVVIDLLRSANDTAMLLPIEDVREKAKSRSSQIYQYSYCLKCLKSILFDPPEQTNVAIEVSYAKKIAALQSVLDSLSDTCPPEQLASLHVMKEQIEVQRKSPNAQPNNAGMVFSEGPTEWPAS